MTLYQLKKVTIMTKIKKEMNNMEYIIAVGFLCWCYLSIKIGLEIDGRDV